MSEALSLVGVSRAFGGTPVLREVSLTLEAGRYITLLGPSGAGKTTLLRLIAGFDQPDAGRVCLGREDVTARPAHERGIGVVFQSFALFPHLDVFDNVAFGLRHRVRQPLRDERAVRAAVDEVLALVGLTGYERRQVTEISGGQKQRVALARCLVNKPQVVLLDEPLGALDAHLRQQMTLELARIQRRIGATFLHVTGHEQEALAMGDRVAVLDGGQVVQYDSPRALFEQPATPRVARLLNAYNQIEVARLSPAAAGHGAAPRDGVLLVRNDHVRVQAPGSDWAGRIGLEGRYVASEYAGSRVLALFDIGAGRHVEVEYQLGHEKPPAFRAGAAYALTWHPSEAQHHGARA